MKRRYIPLSILTALALLFTGCNLLGGSGSSNNSSITQPKTISILISGEVIDAVTDEPIGLDSDAEAILTVFRDGTQSQETTDLEGNASSQFTLEDGVFSFALANTTALPIELNLVAESTGYFSGGSLVVIDQDGEYDVAIKLVPITTEAGAAAGIEQQKTNISSSVDGNGLITAQVTVATDSTANSDGGTLSVNIPAGVEMLDSNGAPVTGDVNIEVAYFTNDIDASTTGASALDSFPGGLEANVEENGVSTEGIFASGGFAAIEISDQSGNSVSELNTSGDAVAVTMSIPAGTVNPDTGVAVIAGDVIPIWSYNQSTGKWSSVSQGQLGALDVATNTYPVSFEITHLSYYNLDWRWNRNQLCSRTNSFRIVDEQGSLIEFPVKFIVQAVSTGYRKTKKFYFSPRNPGEFSLGRAPRTSVTIDVLFESNSIANGSGTNGVVEVDDLCDMPDGFEIPVSIPEIEFVDVEITVNHVCSNNSSIITPVPSNSIYVRKSGSGHDGFWVTTGTDGKATLGGLEANSVYRLWIAERRPGVRGYKRENITATGSPVTINLNVSCNGSATGGSGSGE